MLLLSWEPVAMVFGGLALVGALIWASFTGAKRERGKRVKAEAERDQAKESVNALEKFREGMRRARDRDRDRKLERLRKRAERRRRT